MDRLRKACTRISEALNTVVIKTYRSDSGLAHEVYQLDCSNGQTYSLRLPIDGFIAELDKKGAAMLKHISQFRPHLQVPQPVYECDEFILLRHLSGAHVNPWNTTKLTKETRHKFLDGLALFLVDLWACPSNDQIASCPVYRDWLYGEVDAAFLRSLRPGASWGDPVSFLYRRGQVEGLIPPIDSDTPTIRHGDMNSLNILRDDNGFFSGVIDWDTAKFVPAAAAIQHPLFIADIPGWLNDTPEAMTFENDRKYLEDAICALCMETGNPDIRHIPMLLSSCFERQFLELSLRNKAINAKYIDQRYASFKQNRTLIAKQLEEFIAAHSEMQNEPEVLKIQELLD